MSCGGSCAIKSIPPVFLPDLATWLDEHLPSRLALTAQEEVDLNGAHGLISGSTCRMEEGSCTSKSQVHLISQISSCLLVRLELELQISQETMATKNPSASGSASGEFPRFQDTPTRLGIIAEWIDSKGYGWIGSGGKRHFVHIREFERGQRRPRAGEEIRFIQGIDSKGRSYASKVTFVKSCGKSNMGVWLLLLALLALPLLALWSLPFPGWLGAGAMLLVSAITYRMYAHDKHRAVSAGWRVPESSLHLAELLGGWPGALLAQRRLRHKCSKADYQFVFCCIVILFQIAAVDVILDQRLSRALLAFVNQ